MSATPRRPRPSLAFLASSAVLLAACGSRSSLIEPDDGGTFARADAPATDARDVVLMDTAPECTRDLDCDDGISCTRERCDPSARRCVRTLDHLSCNDRVYCNGEEVCDATAGCVPGRPVQCDDGVACTRDRCDERSRQCQEPPDESLCPLSHGCDPTEGCVARALAHGPTGLFEIRLPSGRVTRIAPLPPGLTDLALSPDRTLYAVARNVLYRIDPMTGAGAVVTRITADFTALDASPEGRVYAGAGTQVFEVDTMTGGARPVVTYPPGFEASGDIAFLSGRLLSTARTSPTSDDTLVEHSLADGTSRVIGPVGSSCVWGLAAFGATLYGLTCNGEVLSIDPATGRGTLVSRAPERFYGATAR